MGKVCPYPYHTHTYKYSNYYLTNLNKTLLLCKIHYNALLFSERSDGTEIFYFIFFFAPFLLKDTEATLQFHSMPAKATVPTKILITTLTWLLFSCPLSPNWNRHYKRCRTCWKAETSFTRNEIWKWLNDAAVGTVIKQPYSCTGLHEAPWNHCELDNTFAASK